jgi:energy-converting hydrogenase Eha subunit C
VSVVNLVQINICWIHLLSTIVKEDSVSRQSSIALCRYGWIHLLSAIAREDGVSCQSSIMYRYIRVWSDLLTTSY